MSSSQIAFWGELVSITGASNPSDLVGLFQFFRPNGDGVELLTNVQTHRVGAASEFNALPVNDDSPDSWIYELVTDYVGSLPRPENPILLLRDAIYSMANDIFLRSYIMWPLYADAAGRPDPFQWYFDLWSKGVCYSFRSANSCRYMIRPAVAKT